MRVELGPLAQSGLEAQGGEDLKASIRAALLFYVQRLQSGRRPTAYPDFLATGASPESSKMVEIEVEEGVDAEFEREAAAQGTTVPALAGHAILLYLAELDQVEKRTATAAAGGEPGDVGL